MASSTGNSDRLDAALAEYLQRQDAGEKMDREAFLAAHPEVAAELAAFLNDDSSVAKAINSSQTARHSRTPRTPGSRGLQIRCPHCSNQVELLVDTPYEDVTCHSCGSTFSLVDREEATRLAAPLKSIGRFELVARLGIGGFGSVWKARDQELDRIVAIKIPRKGQLAPAEIDQFFREARSAAQLRHPNIVPVHEVGRDGDTIFIVCDLVRGVDLSDWLTANRPSGRETAQLCQKVARALHHAHQAGVVHRDLKPSNLMLDAEGEPHLMDFGLAKRELGEITMTVDGQVLGTPAYMSPEQAAGQSHWTDRRTDIYSLGVIMFRMLTGELPFRGNAQMQVYQRLSEDPPSPRKLNRHVPRDLETICLKCLERDPNRRYSTAQDLADELGRFLEGAPIHARPLSPPARLVRWARRKPWLAATAALVAFLAVAGPAAALRLDRQKQRLEDDAVKYNKLIAQNAVDKQMLTRQNGELGRDLDLWEGKANPWKFWPPRADQPPRRQLLQDLYQRRFEPVATQLRAGSHGDWDSARGHLALAVLADEAGRPAEASEQLRAAERLLRRLTEQQPEESSYLVALANCAQGLAQHTADDEPAVSQAYREEAVRIYDRLAARTSDSAAKFRINQFETEWYGAVDAGFAGNSGLLDEVTRLQAQLAGDWPTDPAELYELVSFLARDETARIPVKAGAAE